MTVADGGLRWKLCRRKLAGPVEDTAIGVLDIAGETASARVRDNYLGLTFTDTLSLLKADGRWQIYNKLFNVDGPAA